MDVRQSSLTGAAGEHLVMSRLLSRGYIAALAPQGVLNYDIVVTSQDGEKQCAFQVKTSCAKGADHGWHMQEKHEHIRSDRIFYALVDLGVAGPSTRELQAPVVYVVPSTIVADAVSQSYLTWLTNPGKKGQQRRATKLRRLNFDYTSMCGRDFHLKSGWLEQYRERWSEISGEKATAVKPLISPGSK